MSALLNSGTPTHAKMSLKPVVYIKTENDTDSLGDGPVDEYSGTPVLPAQNIKNEPPLDIDDLTEHESITTGNDGNNFMGFMNENLSDSPKIRLKPASKLMPCPNPTDPKRRFICPFRNCTKAYGKSSHLRSHLTWHTGIKPFVCKEPKCGRGFTRSDELNRHVRTHTGEKPFECVQCTKKFSRSDHLTKHLATHAKQLSGSNTKRTLINTTNNELQQNIEPLHFHSAGQKSQLQQSQLPRHQQNHLRRQPTYVECSDLLQKLTNQNSMEEPPISSERSSSVSSAASDNNHLQFSDGMHFMAALISGNDPLVGETDTKLDSTSVQVKEERPETNEIEFHMMSQAGHPHHMHHQQQLQRQYQQNACTVPLNITETEDDIPPELIMPVSTMICPLSPVSLRSRDPTDDQIMPEANAITLYHENDSLRKFGNNILSGERPFRCVHCEKRFKRQDDLNRHVRTHTGEKPFACGECSRRFMRGDHLKKHMRTHTKER